MSVFLVPEEEEEHYLNVAPFPEHCRPEPVVHISVTLSCGPPQYILSFLWTEASDGVFSVWDAFPCLIIPVFP